MLRSMIFLVAGGFEQIAVGILDNEVVKGVRLVNGVVTRLQLCYNIPMTDRYEFWGTFTIT